MKTEEEWVEDDQMGPELHAKVLALKTCRNRCLAHTKSENALDIAKPVLKMYLTLLQYNGAFSPDSPTEYVQTTWQ